MVRQGLAARWRVVQGIHHQVGGRHHPTLCAADDDAMTPVHDSTTFETNRPGIYLAGTICGGLRTGRWFIENGRHHAQQIAAHIDRGEAPEVDFESRHWKTAE